MTPPAPMDAILARLLALHPRRIDLTLDRMWRLLAALDHPERRLPPVIHVAGTNGKGSTVAFMRAMLEAAGKRVHVYTSPNLVRVNERFRLGRDGGGELVSDQELSEVLAFCESRNGGAPITVFEIETAAAFLLFARHPADVLLLEVGLGGRLDATNVIAHPLASVVTPVSMDHIEFLGDTLAKIAVEKAGIFKRGVPAVIARQIDVARDVLVERIDAVGAVPFVAGQEWMAAEERGRLVYQDADGLLDLPAPRLFGRHQFDNAGTAIAALRAAGLGLPVAAYEDGLVKAEWPARMQRLAAGTLVAAAPAGSEVWLDGGHNAEGGRAVAAALGDLEERVSRPLVLIVGMLSTKDVEGFLQNFLGLALRLIAVPIHQDKGRPAEEIAATARGLGLAADACASLDEAIARVGALDLEPPPRILITGSLYLAGEVLSANGTPPR
ncbi:bifunctional folylpolyglutamate synthase/dihydrofolate synthase [Rhodoplanes elegans]|uniref:Dihydrofolate synthase/folylpolyglutamate synthase n=1 Tax=Rhodoplanes elegans TaxID=29408 RepID=A0A327KLL5_9BRAD|nr:folylpolyglutamate synthase/dihydrofolate synthase family protein [Rhodoplanes elegans]MBK5958900.1 bifunctional folylpolyglutamate synthase/dihydrofolate synthase [Rhodoplanes elegans]RAI38423.1 bifunctional folylpolyglutamate synthase/dihydrofolate synthase [Rhodoplanes elegans]